MGSSGSDNAGALSGPGRHQEVPGDIIGQYLKAHENSIKWHRNKRTACNRTASYHCRSEESALATPCPLCGSLLYC